MFDRKTPSHTSVNPVVSAVNLTRLFVAALLVFAASFGFSQSVVLAIDTEQDKEIASSDRNLVESMLYQWWAPFEAPNGKVFLPFVDRVFAGDAYLKMGDVELKGREAIRQSLKARPLKGGISHHLDSMEITPLTGGQFQIDAGFIYQVQLPDGKVQAGKSSYTHTVEKQRDGTFRFKVLTANLGAPITGVEFKDTHYMHQAHGTITQYLGITDLLDSDYARLSDVMTDETEIHGMFDPAKETFNERGDGILRGAREIKVWLSSRKNNFSWVSHHLTSVDLKALGNNRFQASTTMDVKAAPLSGGLVEVSLPIKLTLKSDGSQFMKIIRVDR